MKLEEKEVMRHKIMKMKKNLKNSNAKKLIKIEIV